MVGSYQDRIIENVGIENRLGTLIESLEDTSINVLVQFQCFGLLNDTIIQSIQYGVK